MTSSKPVLMFGVAQKPRRVPIKIGRRQDLLTSKNYMPRSNKRRKEIENQVIAGRKKYFTDLMNAGLSANIFENWSLYWDKKSEYWDAIDEVQDRIEHNISDPNRTKNIYQWDFYSELIKDIDEHNTGAWYEASDGFVENKYVPSAELIDRIINAYLNIVMKKNILGKYKYSHYNTYEFHKQNKHQDLIEIVSKTAGATKTKTIIVMDQLFWGSQDGSIFHKDYIFPQNAEATKGDRTVNEKTLDKENVWQKFGLPSYTGYAVGGILVLGTTAYILSQVGAVARAFK